MKTPLLLGVNIDHVATLRQVRMTDYPVPLKAALLAIDAGADSITVHLREDRRHIQDEDVLSLKRNINTPLNLEMAVIGEMLDFAERLRPDYCCLVPERREELTTEGGLDVVNNKSAVMDACLRLSAAGIRVSLFIDADEKQIYAAADVEAPAIEIHTGQYADATVAADRGRELEKITLAVDYAKSLGLLVNAGHGLNYDNVDAVARIPHIHELNIGHAIVARSLFKGFSAAVSEMKALLSAARK